MIEPSTAGPFMVLIAIIGAIYLWRGFHHSDRQQINDEKRYEIAKGEELGFQKSMAQQLPNVENAVRHTEKEVYEVEHELKSLSQMITEEKIILSAIKKVLIHDKKEGLLRDNKGLPEEIEIIRICTRENELLFDVRPKLERILKEDERLLNYFLNLRKKEIYFAHRMKEAYKIAKHDGATNKVEEKEEKREDIIARNEKIIEEDILNKINKAKKHINNSLSYIIDVININKDILMDVQDNTKKIKEKKRILGEYYSLLHKKIRMLEHINECTKYLSEEEFIIEQDIKNLEVLDKKALNV